MVKDLQALVDKDNPDLDVLLNEAKRISIQETSSLAEEARMIARSHAAVPP